ncbi:lytic transglycosylase domain-containing protein [Microbacterium hominis]|uniref:Lytic transglycosylase domain-containing protein n=1 Tax=Microbacterium hominis TaxID=162426 RepID=A0A7D4UIQ4_9MICO|nr:lytic transglycosylase domain-containing protein [Microbacterium hominis]QKJ18727.1 lytic transglycosylase domain-containing protein [Microbacterium hominis]
MRSNSPDALTRRARRARRRSTRRLAAVAASVAIGLTATVGAATAVPLTSAQAQDSFGSFELASYTTTLEPVAVVSAEGTDDISTAAYAALDATDSAVAAAAQVEEDITASGLDIGTDDITIDTGDLADAAERLQGGLDMPAPLIPDLTDDVTALVASVETRVTELRTGLDAAIKKKAEEEAAEKARREAEAKAAAEKAAAEKAAAEAAAAAAANANANSGSSSGTSAPAPAPTYAAAGTSAAEAQSIARSMLPSFGWGDDQFGCLVSLWNKESGWNSQAYNPSSGAFGIPQALPGSKMASAGADWQTNAATQIRWGLGYIQGRYGSPCGAWGHSQAYGWY